MMLFDFWALKVFASWYDFFQFVRFELHIY